MTVLTTAWRVNSRRFWRLVRNQASEISSRLCHSSVRIPCRERHWQAIPLQSMAVQPPRDLLHVPVQEQDFTKINSPLPPGSRGRAVR